jgi:hypothetical protein
MEREKESGKFKRQYDVDHTFFDSINTEEKAYILGFLYADGTNQIKSNCENTISFTQLEQDKDILEKINIALKSTYLLYESIQKTNNKKKYKLTISSQKLSDRASELGAIPNKSLLLKFPNLSIFKSEDLIRHFIRGYFDGDGCIWDGKPKKMLVKNEKKPGEFRERIVHNVKFTFTGNFEFINALQDYLVKTLNFKKTKLNFSKAKETKHICTMEYSGRGQVKKLYDFMYKNATIFGNRKKTKFEDINCALEEKSSSEIGLIAGKPEMVISSQA